MMRHAPAAALLALGLVAGEAHGESAGLAGCEPETAGNRRTVRVAAGPGGSAEPFRAALAAAAREPRALRLALEGTAFLEAPLRLGREHAGLVLEAGPAGVLLLGGIDLSGRRWQPAADGALETMVEPARLPEGVLDLHLDGRRLDPAREPDPEPGDLRSGWLLTAPGTAGSTSFRARPGDLAGIRAEPGLRALLYDANQWSTDLVRIARLDPQGGRVELSGAVDWHRLGPGTPYRLEGGRRFLDRPGEWHYDPGTGRLALRPPAGGLRPGHRLVGATLDTLLHLEEVEDVTVRGLALAAGSPRGSDRAPPYFQIGGGAIRVDRGRAIRLCGNAIEGVGVGIALASVEDALVAGNRIRGTAGNAIYVGMPWGGRPSRRVRIEGNRIEDVGHRFADSSGVLLQGVIDARVEGNRIERTAQFGVYALQARPNGEDRIREIRIERNRIRAANLQTADGGGIKLFAAVQDEPMEVLVRANWVDGTTHLMAGPDGRFFAPDDFDGRRWPQPVAPAIYLDWYARGVTVEGNLLTGNYAGVSIVNGSDNRITGNVVLGGAGTALGVDNKTPQTPGRPAMAGNRIEANIVLLERPGSLAVGIWDLADAAGAAAFSGNLYGGPALGAQSFVAGPGRLPGGARSGGIQLWARSRYVAGTEHEGEPGFRDPGRLDLRLDPEGAAVRLGLPALDPWLLEPLRSGP